MLTKAKGKSDNQIDFPTTTLSTFKMAAANTTLYYELYRLSTIGQALIDTVDDLINDSRIEPQLAHKILYTFDRVIAETLAERVKSRLSFKGHLETYRFCDDVWTFLVKDVQFKNEQNVVFNADKIKIVSCNSKRPGEA